LIKNWNLNIDNCKFKNMYTTPILWMLSWPVLIIISYQLVKLAVKKFEERLEDKEESDQ
jgi:hypothetical protein